MDASLSLLKALQMLLLISSAINALDLSELIRYTSITTTTTKNSHPIGLNLPFLTSTYNFIPHSWKMQNQPLLSPQTYLFIVQTHQTPELRPTPPRLRRRHLDPLSLAQPLRSMTRASE